MSPAMINTFIGGCVIALMTVAGFLISNWMNGMKESNNKLTAAIEKLTDIITGIEKRQEVHSFQIERIEKDIEMLQTTNKFVQMIKDPCPMPGACPAKPAAITHP